MGRWMDAAQAANSQKRPGAVLTKPPKAPDAPLLAVLAVPDPGAFVKTRAANDQAPAVPTPASCATCAHRTRAGVCGDPVAAGPVVFCDTVADGGASCSAWRAGPVAWRGQPGTPTDRGAVLTGDDGAGLVLCVDCGHWRPGRCRNHMAAGLVGFELAAGWHELPQRCAGFRKARRPEAGPMHGHATEGAPWADSWPARGIVEGERT